jgi:hypothetical protein
MDNPKTYINENNLEAFRKIYKSKVVSKTYLSPGLMGLDS